MTAIRIAPSVISREIGGTFVVLDVGRRVYFQLDRTAASIWRAIETFGQVDRVVDDCAAAFGHELANVDRDVRQFVDAAADWGLVVEAAEQVAPGSSVPSWDAPALSVDRSGIRLTSDIEPLRRQFLERPYLELPGFIAPGLLAILGEAVERGEFVDRAHLGIGTEVCLESGAATSACQLVFNDPALLEAATRIADCPAVRCFDGRVYRLDGRSGHYDSWHSDASDDRILGLSVNLSREPYEGGVLEIRRAAAPEAEHAVASAGFGSAVLFHISPELRHRVTTVRGVRPRTAYAGWFRTSPDFADAFLRTFQSRPVTVAR